MARLLHLTGSAVDPLLDDVSRLYARGCLDAAGADHDHVIAHVSPGGAWRFPTALDDAAPCDYLMLTRAELDTNRGAAWLASPQGRAWRAVAERGAFVVFGVQPRQVPPTPES